MNIYMVIRRLSYYLLYLSVMVPKLWATVPMGAAWSFQGGRRLLQDENVEKGFNEIEIQPRVDKANFVACVFPEM